MLFFEKHFFLGGDKQQRSECYYGGGNPKGSGECKAGYIEADGLAGVVFHATAPPLLRCR